MPTSFEDGARHDSMNTSYEGPSPSKRAKPAPPETETSPVVLREGLFDNASRDSLKESFQSAEPFTHVVIRDLCQRDVLIQARNELINNVEAKFKETDLFKVYQTGDLANLDGLEPELAAKLPTLLKIRNAIYSQQFRHFIEDITNTPRGTLTEQTDCSSNVYAHGCHLICHDDVISTRWVSYIIYLTDPDEEWQESDGGALELFEVRPGEGCDVDVVPAKSLLPYFNSMALFTVQPGKSFHAVQEVYTDSKPRLSISGWFHALAPPPGVEQASLNQLKSAADAAPFEPLSHSLNGTELAPGCSFELTEAHREYLRSWLNPMYLEAASKAKMLALWETDSCVQLHSILRKDVADKIRDLLRAADARDGLGRGQVPAPRAGEALGWNFVGPCHKQRFLGYRRAAPAEAPATASAAAPAEAPADTAAEARCALGELLSTIEHELLRSPAFAAWLKQFTDLGILACRSQVRRFRPGSDYTVAHFGMMSEAPTLDITMCFVDDADENSRAAWRSDDVGGFQCYMLADNEANSAAETYRADVEDDSSIISCSASFNTLNVILRDQGLMKFVKFVSHDAPGSRCDIALECHVDLRDDEIEAAQPSAGDGS